MILTINLKQIGQRKQKIAPVEFDYTPVSQTLRELVTETVKPCVKAYNEQASTGENQTNPLSEEQIMEDNYVLG